MTAPDDRRKREKRPPKPLNEQALKDLALHYLGRFATTRARLVQYMQRKVRERGWAEERAPDFDRLADRCVELGYVDDAAFAAMKGGALLRRGYGARRVEQALVAAGVGEVERGAVRETASDQAAASAIAFARRKRIGPFAPEPAPAERRQKQLQAFIRAGHDFALARSLVFADSMEEITGLDELIGRDSW
ncbi:regulatory protein [Blastomonas natatoria]|uniref:Regulatory protein n=1 Tax=Blastomonas natatoria TaxID=34015 RepID=A0A2V3UXQ8_9SPHN|nr:RecX family transcriptional regulator [Blastomonas natatoria]PXW72895.1 regulatory protein [Blastomonas natatoria]